MAAGLHRADQLVDTGHTSAWRVPGFDCDFSGWVVPVIWWVGRTKSTDTREVRIIGISTAILRVLSPVVHTHSPEKVHETV